MDLLSDSFANTNLGLSLTQALNSETSFARSNVDHTKFTPVN